MVLAVVFRRLDVGGTIGVLGFRWEVEDVYMVFRGVKWKEQLVCLGSDGKSRVCSVVFRGVRWKD